MLVLGCDSHCLRARRLESRGVYGDDLFDRFVENKVVCYLLHKEPRGVGVSARREEGRMNEYSGCTDLDAYIVPHTHTHLDRDTVPDGRDDGIHDRPHSRGSDRSRTSLMFVVRHAELQKSARGPDVFGSFKAGIYTHGSCDNTVNDNVSPHYARKEKRG